MKEFEDTKWANRNRQVRRQKDRGQQKDKHRTHTTTLKTKAGVTQTLQKSGSVQVLRKG